MILWYFPVLVADVEVKEDCILIRLRKEAVVCESKDSDKEVSSSAPAPVVEGVSEVGSEVAVSSEAIPEGLAFGSREAFSLERVNNFSMEELYSGGQCDGSVTSSSHIS